MKKITKRIIAVVLTLCMAVSLFVLPVSAKEILPVSITAITQNIEKIFEPVINFVLKFAGTSETNAVASKDEVFLSVNSDSGTGIDDKAHEFIETFKDRIIDYAHAFFTNAVDRISSVGNELLNKAIDWAIEHGFDASAFIAKVQEKISEMFAH